MLDGGAETLKMNEDVGKFNLGLGNDSMTMRNSFGSRATLNGGTNTGNRDTLTESGNEFTELFSIINFEQVNHQ